RTRLWWCTSPRSRRSPTTSSATSRRRSRASARSSPRSACRRSKSAPSCAPAIPRSTSGRAARSAPLTSSSPPPSRSTSCSAPSPDGGGSRPHARERDLQLEIPASPLEAVMSGEVWTQIYDRLAELVSEHRTTLVFVNTRRQAERIARHLSERLGEQHVTAHHGSMAKESRVAAESRLKRGELRALVATASLELG